MTKFKSESSLREAWAKHFLEINNETLTVENILTEGRLVDVEVNRVQQQAKMQLKSNYGIAVNETFRTLILIDGFGYALIKEVA